MESNPQTTALAVMAGIFCLLAVALLAGLAIYNMRRARPQAARPPTAAPPPRTAAASQRIVGPGGPSVGPQIGGADSAYDEEEMPTVVVNQPQRPPPVRPAAETPAGRTRGATIIAFDEDEEEDG